MKRALLIIDVQNEYFSGALPVSYPRESFDNILRAIDVANRQKIPVVLVQHTNPEDAPTFAKGSEGWKLHSEVKSKGYEHIIEKRLPGSFTGTDLEAWLRANNIDTVVVAGYMTQMCCDTTARQAMHLGFDVEFLSDATGTLSISNYAGEVSDEDLHKAILVTQAMRFSRVLTTEEWVENLVK
ncbi:cysteine hydrolase family protein [Methanobacterium congolense]|uniref:Putative isochorismatase family protein YrdC n=1 Tax=Methanobacterium congolense TaxID=118062 RepID=A0A1D3L4Y3_9EURY|nr:cysteine hydrolase family protein [Methanobacterium congolense]SCG86694.1 putative isochorismatase family protein YrdC [Methanobacterium congolense]